MSVDGGGIHTGAIHVDLTSIQAAAAPEAGCRSFNTRPRSGGVGKLYKNKIINSRQIRVYKYSSSCTVPY